MGRMGQAASAFPVRVQESHHAAVDWPVIAVTKQFPAHTRTGSHRHERGQLLHALEGLAVATTDAGTWFVPAGHALWMPPELVHDVAMYTDVRMQTAYVRPDEGARIGGACRVLKISLLLDAALRALADEMLSPLPTPRAEQLAWLTIDEVQRAPDTAFVLPLPRDPRLARIAQALLAAPGSEGTIDYWSDFAGLSRRSLTRLFREQTGLSFGDWRRRLRLVSAIKRLSDGEPLARIAASLGYRDLSAFRAMAARYQASKALSSSTRVERRGNR